MPYNMAHNLRPSHQQSLLSPELSPMSPEPQYSPMSPEPQFSPMSPEPQYSPMPGHPQSPEPRATTPSGSPGPADPLTSYCRLLADIRARTHQFHAACRQVILLNHKILDAKRRYERARADFRLSFRYSNRLKLTSLEGVRDLIYDLAVSLMHQVEGLQAQLQQHYLHALQEQVPAP